MLRTHRDGVLLSVLMHSKKKKKKKTPWSVIKVGVDWSRK